MKFFQAPIRLCGPLGLACGLLLGAAFPAGAIVRGARSDHADAALLVQRSFSRSLREYRAWAELWAIRGDASVSFPEAASDVLFFTNLTVGESPSVSEGVVNHALADSLGLREFEIRDIVARAASQLTDSATVEPGIMFSRAHWPPFARPLLLVAFPTPGLRRYVGLLVSPDALGGRVALSQGFPIAGEVSLVRSDGVVAFSRTGCRPGVHRFEPWEVLESLFQPDKVSGLVDFRSGEIRWRAGYSTIPGTTAAIVVATEAGFLSWLRSRSGERFWIWLLCAAAGLLAFLSSGNLRSRFERNGLLSWRRFAGFLLVTVQFGAPFFAGCCLVLAARQVGGSDPAVSAIVRETTGHVWRSSAGRNSRWESVRMGDQIPVGEHIRTGRSSALRVQLADGTSVFLGPESEFMLKEGDGWPGLKRLNAVMERGVLEVTRPGGDGITGRYSRSLLVVLRRLGESFDVTAADAQFLVLDTDTAQVSVLAGSVARKGSDLSVGDYALTGGRVKKGDAILAEMARLRSLPGHGRHRATIRWKVRADMRLQLEVARGDPWLHNPQVIPSHSENTAAVELPPALYFWRLSDGRGPRTAIRSLWIREAKRPVSTMPRRDATIRSERGGVGSSLVHFSWKANGPGPFRVEIREVTSRAKPLEILTMSTIARARLPEGRYTWKVVALASHGFEREGHPSFFHVRQAGSDAKKAIDGRWPRNGDTALCDQDTVDLLLRPQLRLPVDGAFMIDRAATRFVWDRVPGALGYEVEVLRPGDFVSHAFVREPLFEAWLPAAGESLVWRVRSVGPGHVRGNWEHFRLLPHRVTSPTRLPAKGDASVPAPKITGMRVEEI